MTLTEELELRWNKGELRDQYFGYMVIRPTQATPIGRTMLSSRAIKGFSGYLIESEHVIHVLGYRLVIRGFPFMQQHSDVSVCAHAVCWAILRHFSERYRRYAEFLVHDITRMASEADPGGLSPSRGLDMNQACRVFSAAGHYPDIHSRKDGNHFDRYLAAYVESGLPVFASLEDYEHAIAIVGLGNIDRTSLEPSGELQHVWDATNSLVISDDNDLPYEVISYLDEGRFKIHDIDSFIVPLPEKVFFPAEAVEPHVKAILDGVEELDFEHLKNGVMRYFLSTTSSFKEHVQKSRTQYPPDFFIALTELVMPQYIWVVELSTLTDWQAGRCNSVFLVDATASATDVLPFFVLHDRQKAFIYDRGLTREQGWITFDTPLLGLSELRSNLTRKI